MKIKYGFLTLRSNIVIHILIMVEIFVLVTAANISAASIKNRTMLYEPLKPYLEKRGFYACSFNEGAPDASEAFDSASSIVNIKFYYDSHIEYSILSDEIFDSLDLPLKSGRKFKAKSKGKYPKLIVSSNNEGYKKGDILTDDQGQNYEIAAVLTDLSYFLDFNTWMIDMTYKEFYHSIDIKYDDAPRFYTSESQVKDLNGIKTEASVGMIVNYPKDTPDEIIEKDMEIMSQFGAATANSEIFDRSEAVIRDDIKKMFPPVIMFGVIVLLGIVSCAIITARKNISKLAVFYCCGASRADCIWINFGNMMLSVLFASAASALTLFFILRSSLPYKYGLAFSMNNLYVSLIIIVLILGISLAAPMKIISNKKVYASMCIGEKE